MQNIIIKLLLISKKTIVSDSALQLFVFHIIISPKSNFDFDYFDHTLLRRIRQCRCHLVMFVLRQKLLPFSSDSQFQDLSPARNLSSNLISTNLVGLCWMIIAAQWRVGLVHLGFGRRNHLHYPFPQHELPYCSFLSYVRSSRQLMDASSSIFSAQFHESFPQKCA